MTSGQMRRFNLQVGPGLVRPGRWFLLFLFCGKSALAASGLPMQFDLLCSGAGIGIGAEQRTQAEIEAEAGPAGTGPGEEAETRVFSTHFRIDLGTNEFCNENYCSTFIDPGVWAEHPPRMLEYRCDLVSIDDLFCWDIFSTGGPRILHEYFVLDLSDYSFYRTSVGDGGDIRSYPFNVSYTGQCTLAPFSGLDSKAFDERARWTHRD